MKHKLRIWRFRWVMGRHSGIPRCCIVWFFLRYWSVPKPIRTLSARYLPIHRPNYIRCAVCALRDRTIDLHLCYPGCGGPVKPQRRPT